MPDETPKMSAGKASLSLWFVKAGTPLAEVKLRTDRSVKDAVAATALLLKKRYQSQQRKLADARAVRVGR